MRPAHLLAAVTLAVALLLPGAASAAPRTVTSAAVTRDALTVALRFWGAEPCGGRVGLATRRTPATGMARDSDAWVTFRSPLGDNALAAPAATYSKCTIRFARLRWPSATSMNEDWPLLCTTTIHEVGHLLGYAHDSRPGSVMAPVFTRSSELPAVCRTTAPLRG